MPLKNNSIILNISNNNDGNNDKMIWKRCSRCGVLCYKSDWCKPCKMKIQLLDTHPLARYELNTLIDIFNEVVLHVCRTLTIKKS